MQLHHHFGKCMALFVLIITAPVYAGTPARFEATVASDGTIFRLDRSSGSVDRLLSNGNVTASFPLPFKAKKGVRLACEEEHLFISPSGSRKIYELDRSGQVIRKLKFPDSIRRLLVSPKQIIAFPDRYRKGGSLYWVLDRETGKVRKYYFKLKDLVGNRYLKRGRDRDAIIMGLSWGAACLDGPNIRYVVPVGSDLLKLKEERVLDRQTIPLPTRILINHSKERDYRRRPHTTMATLNALVYALFPLRNNRLLGQYVNNGTGLLFLWEDHQGILAKKPTQGMELVGIFKDKAILLNPKTGAITRIPIACLKAN